MRYDTPLPTQTFNGHSMVGPLQRVLVCSPRAAAWNDSSRVSAWRDLGFHHAPNFDIAQSQHAALTLELESAGAELLHLPPIDNLSLDAVYTHRANSLGFQPSAPSLRREPPKLETWSGLIRKRS
jgi:hypothetical protein